MKKLILLSVTFLVGSGIYAQQKLKTGFLRERNTNTASTANSKTGNGIPALMTLAGYITSNNNYVAGMANTLSFTLWTTNTDQEYIDSLSLTFPANFTITATNANPTFPTDDNGGGDEPYNGIAGQDITWGSHIGNTDNYGGIWAGSGISFTIDVTIGSGVTGPQTINFFAKGDEYPGTLMPAQPNGNLSGTITVFPATTVDLKALAVEIPYGCGLTANEQVTMWVKNVSTNAASNFDLHYIVNGGATVVETYTGTAIAPGDTLMYVFTTPIDMSATNGYDVWGITAIAGDGNPNDDSAYIQSASFTSVAYPYSTSFEATPVTDLLGWTTFDADGMGITWLVNTTSAHSGVQTMRVLETTPGVSDDWLFSNCIDLIAGNSYKVSWWKRLTATYNGSLGVFLGNNNDALSMTTTLSAVTPVTIGGQWLADSVTFVASVTGTYYLGFEAVNPNGSQQIAMRLDDINITDLGVINDVSNPNKKSFEIYPNPSTGNFNLFLPNNITLLEIYNVLGEKVFSKVQLLAGTSTLDLSDFASGTYTLRAISNHQISTQKIMISK